MINLTINSIKIEIPEGTPVIDAARLHGFEIPSMCYREGKKHFTSCMVCMVKDNITGKLLPSCSVKVTEGMDITTMDEEVIESRKMALDLLLSEHVGDCEAPCQITCPAHMDIPLMNRHLASGDFAEALKVVKKDIALPSVFGRVCPAPCEGACRRKSLDESVSICLLKRAAGDTDIELDQSWIPAKAARNGKTIAILGAGPAGLSAAYYLALRGYDCKIFDRREKPGGTLWNEVEHGNLPSEILEKETGMIAALGVEFHQDITIDKNLFEDLTKKYDAVLISTGSGESGAKEWVEVDDKGVVADRNNYFVKSNIFVAGSAMKHSKMAIRALGQGKEAAFSVDQMVQGKEITGERALFNSRFGKLVKEELAEYLKESSTGKRIEPNEAEIGLNREEVMGEAARCLHCDCRELTSCKLRLLSDEYRADQKRFWSADRKIVKKCIQQDVVIYEPSKCIKCGICVDMTAEHKEEYGMTFIGRGFDVVVGVPFNEQIGVGLKIVALEVADACPTGAICRLT